MCVCVIQRQMKLHLSRVGLELRQGCAHQNPRRVGPVCVWGERCLVGRQRMVGLHSERESVCGWVGAVRLWVCAYTPAETPLYPCWPRAETGVCASGSQTGWSCGVVGEKKRDVWSSKTNGDFRSPLVLGERRVCVYARIKIACVCVCVQQHQLKLALPVSASS